MSEKKTRSPKQLESDYRLAERVRKRSAWEQRLDNMVKRERENCARMCFDEGEYYLERGFVAKACACSRLGMKIIGEKE